MPPSSPSAWWKRAILYQVYPRSFQDSNDDGIGDLAGILAHLPYLAELGVDALWLSPIFPSPMADFGYDISDYTAIDPVFGTLADLDALVACAHASGLKLLLDLVPNHTSDQHPWFVESRASRASAKRDWYIWRDPAPGGGPPSNWLSEFGGSAWEWDAASGQYYYHAFLAQQPDLNWRNREVRAAIYEVMRFWLRRGIDGFRIDVIWHLIKDDQFRDNPLNPAWAPGQPPTHRFVPLYTTDRPEVQDVIAEMRRVVDGFAGRVLIGEIYLPMERLVRYYGRDHPGLHLPFNFALLSAPWNAREIARIIDAYEAALPPGGWPNWVLGNHDRARIASRVGRAQARVAAMLLLTLRGTPTCYYGDEIAMYDVAIPTDRVRDPLEKNMPGLGLGRDGCRTPMQWDAGAFAGFSRVEPWLPLAADFRAENVDNERKDPESTFNLYRALIRLRRRTAALVEGTYRPVHATGQILLYWREGARDRLLVALNFGDEPVRAELDGLRGRIALSTHCDRADEPVDRVVDLRPNEGVVVDAASAD
jgi:alpha-glucosidase